MKGKPFRREEIKVGYTVVLTKLPPGYYQPSPGYPLFGSEFSTTGVVESVRDNSVLVAWGKVGVVNVHELDHLTIYHANPNNCRIEPNRAFFIKKGAERLERAQKKFSS